MSAEMAARDGVLSATTRILLLIRLGIRRHLGNYSAAWYLPTHGLTVMAMCGILSFVVSCRCLKANKARLRQDITNRTLMQGLAVSS